MDKKQELLMLEEIESSIEPEFSLLPEYRAYDENLEIIGENKEPRILSAQGDLKDLVKYIVFKKEIYNHYLKIIVPHVQADGITYLEYLAVKQFGQKKDGPKFFI